MRPQTQRQRQRREFSIKTAAAAAAAWAAGTSWVLPAQAQPAPAQPAAIREGKDYRKLNKPAPTETPAGQVEVIEFFWYSCGHCNSFEPSFSAWIKTAPKDLRVLRVPVAFNASFVPQQKIFYALEGLGKTEALHAKVFHAIHIERLKLNKDEEIFAWMGKQGVDVTKFKEMYNSFTVSNQVRKATQLQDAYGVEGVPSMGIAGRYYTDGTLAGSLPAVLKVVEQLAAQARKG